ncbi:hypothetical protein [Burkholderia pyrrocinia]|nr:hypothetical protein [Burkholderia pyrrocinia]
MPPRYPTADKSNDVSLNRFPVNLNTAFAIVGVTAGLAPRFRRQ